MLSLSRRWIAIHFRGKKKSECMEQRDDIPNPICDDSLGCSRRYWPMRGRFCLPQQQQHHLKQERNWRYLYLGSSISLFDTRVHLLPHDSSQRHLSQRDIVRNKCTRTYSRMPRSRGRQLFVSTTNEARRFIVCLLVLLLVRAARLGPLIFPHPFGLAWPTTWTLEAHMASTETVPLLFHDDSTFESRGRSLPQCGGRALPGAPRCAHRTGRRPNGTDPVSPHC